MGAGICFDFFFGGGDNFGSLNWTQQYKEMQKMR